MEIVVANLRHILTTTTRNLLELEDGFEKASKSRSEGQSIHRMFKRIIQLDFINPDTWPDLTPFENKMLEFVIPDTEGKIGTSRFDNALKCLGALSSAFEFLSIHKAVLIRIDEKFETLIESINDGITLLCGAIDMINISNFSLAISKGNV